MWIVEGKEGSFSLSCMSDRYAPDVDRQAKIVVYTGTKVYINDNWEMNCINRRTFPALGQVCRRCVLWCQEQFRYLPKKGTSGHICFQFVWRRIVETDPMNKKPIMSSLQEQIHLDNEERCSLWKTIKVIVLWLSIVRIWNADNFFDDEIPKYRNHPSIRPTFFDQYLRTKRRGAPCTWVWILS